MLLSRNCGWILFIFTLSGFWDLEQVINTWGIKAMSDKRSKKC